MATAGVPRSIRWDRKKGCFEYRFLADPRITGPTELFAPPECLGAEPLISLEGPGGEEPSLKAEFDPEQRRVFITNRGYAGEVTCTILRTYPGWVRA